MKRMLTMFLLILLSITIIGCGDLVNEIKTAAIVEDDLDNYLPQRDKLIDKDAELMNQFTNKFIDEEDWDKSYDALKSIVSEYEQLLQEVKSVSFKTEELKQVHAIYIQSTTLTLESLNIYQSYMENESDELWEKAGNLMDEAYKTGENHDNKLLEVAEKYGIDLTLE